MWVAIIREGSGGIRTLAGRDWPVPHGFVVRCIKPLCHASRFNVKVEEVIAAPVLNYGAVVICSRII